MTCSPARSSGKVGIRVPTLFPVVCSLKPTQRLKCLARYRVAGRFVTLGEVLGHWGTGGEFFEHVFEPQGNAGTKRVASKQDTASPTHPRWSGCEKGPLCYGRGVGMAPAEHHGVPAERGADLQGYLQPKPLPAGKSGHTSMGPRLAGCKWSAIGPSAAE